MTKITFNDYVWNTSLVHQMSFDEIDQAIIEAKRQLAKNPSDITYWMLISMIEHLQKHLISD